MSFRTLKADLIRRNVLNTDFFAETVTLTARDGEETEAVAKPGTETTEERQSEHGTELVVTREFFLELTGDVPESVTFDGSRYAVEGDTKTGEFTTLKTKRIGAAERSRESYRRRVS